MTRSDDDRVPAGLTVISKLLPITHVLALMCYGLFDRTGQVSTTSGA